MLQIWRKKLVGNFLDGKILGEKFPGGKFPDEKVPIYRKKYVGKILGGKIPGEFVPTYRKNFDGKIPGGNFPGEKIPVGKIPGEFFPGPLEQRRRENSRREFSRREIPVEIVPTVQLSSNPKSGTRKRLKFARFSIPDLTPQERFGRVYITQIVSALTECGLPTRRISAASAGATCRATPPTRP